VAVSVSLSGDYFAIVRPIVVDGSRFFNLARGLVGRYCAAATPT
jgi:hypothetical protein